MDRFGNLDQSFNFDDLFNYEARHRCLVIPVTQNPTRLFLVSTKDGSMRAGLKGEYIVLIRERYQKSDKVLRGIILDELVRNLGCHRKSAIRLVNYKLKPKGARGRKKLYSEASQYHLRKLWRIMDFPAAKRLKSALRNWLPRYKQCGDELKVELLKMSAATIDRILKPVRARMRRHNNTGTVSALHKIKTQIPIKSFSTAIDGPGYTEADTVAHCGGALEGLFAWSLTVTDIDSRWTENDSLWGKTGGNVRSAFVDIEKRLPFAIKVVWVDNGNEFLNNTLTKYLWNRSNPIKLERGRPYRKNDQCHVEQKNFTHVRQLFGYQRYDQTAKVVDLMNDIYRNEWRLLQNFFMPQMKLIEKLRIGAKVKRKHDHPQTPYERLLQSSRIPNAKKNELRELFTRLDPFELKIRLEQKLRTLDAFIRTHNYNQGKAA